MHFIMLTAEEGLDKLGSTIGRGGTSKGRPEVKVATKDPVVWLLVVLGPGQANE